jgi:uncharacterized protein (DUF1778 family)
VAAASTSQGQHQLAYLRAMAEGVPQREAAVRYLGLDPSEGAVSLRRAHQAIVDRARAAARRAGDHRWRLIGLTIRASAEIDRPALDDWAAAQGLGEFGQAELLALYHERLGRSSSDFMRDAACRLAEEVLLDQTYFALDAHGIVAFQEMLDDPPAPTDRLRGTLMAKTPCTSSARWAGCWTPVGMKRLEAMATVMFEEDRGHRRGRQLE